MSEKALAVKEPAGAQETTSWREWLKAKAKALKEAIASFLAPKPLRGRMFYVAARIVAATVGSLAAVLVWSTLIVGASYGFGTVLVAFGFMIALLVVTVMRITIDPEANMEVVSR